MTFLNERPLFPPTSWAAFEIRRGSGIRYNLIREKFIRIHDGGEVRFDWPVWIWNRSHWILLLGAFTIEFSRIYYNGCWVAFSFLPFVVLNVEFRAIPYGRVSCEIFSFISYKTFFFNATDRYHFYTRNIRCRNYITK